MLGLPGLPRKLPSRNWLIFWGLSSSLAAAIIYDKREKKRATARWVAAVAPLAREPLPNPSAMPRRVTVFLEAPPGDGLRVAQDHFAEYVKPVLASSGLDWDFVVGRRQGDVRAVVAERVRRSRRALERDLGETTAAAAEDAPTDEDVVEAVRQKNGTAEYEGRKGDIIVGRHTWKEYVRGLHEGWLGPLAPPPEPVVEAQVPTTTEIEGKMEAAVSPSADTEAAPSTTPPPPPAPEEEKPKGPPPQPRPYNTPDQYPSSPLPRFIPGELGPSAPIPFPHLLGFSSTPTRLWRFLNRRHLADEVGREVAAVCFCTVREYRESIDGYEQERVLAHEERDWIKSVWKEETAEKKETPASDGPTRPAPLAPFRENVWTSPVVVDPRIANRMLRFALSPDTEAAGRSIVVPEEAIEGWTKGKLRQLARWGLQKWRNDSKPVNVGNLDDVD
ncbi:Mitochondrial import inner membrane translocase subunit Tim54 [Niveomyces insectorum RCEF 264]|uniref:Mitochondrial import inner membrane translocase subunit TIM54 n=1 Tax=Niveomyces insectorum RCEF 264 TaxID=1081102 RepID=A0A167UQ72_9HYPO|nr:Mitochondrial import inner membrane translocase subunit Tim54 [Niveomyces insectorum RCEF 264]